VLGITGEIMATVHFVKDGKLANGERVTKSVDVPATLAAERLVGFDTRHTKTAPTINPEGTPSDWAPYKHVVLEIEQGEETSHFSEPGYYYLIGLTPAECQNLLGVSAPSV
jgi:hypothetical protein